MKENLPNFDFPNVVTLECSVCHRGLFLKMDQFLARSGFSFYFDVWNGNEYCPDHKPSLPPRPAIGPA